MQDNSKQNFLKGSIKIGKESPKLNIFSNWINTNRMLNDFYKRPEINILDNDRGLNIKNSMRHIVGSSKYQQDYGLLAKPLGYVKEGWDFLTEPFIYMAQNRSLNYPKYLTKTIKDSVVDLKNNKIGRDFIKQNPNANNEAIMQYALKQAINNHDTQYNEEKALSKFQKRLLELKGDNDETGK